MNSIRRIWPRLALLLFFGFLIFIFNNFTKSGAQVLDSQEYLPHRVIVQPKIETTRDEIDNIIRGLGANRVEEISQLNLHILELPSQLSEKAVAAILNHNPKIRFAEVDSLLKPSAVPNDYYYAFNWHLKKINAPLAWDTSKGDGVVIAIIDSGVAANHVDLFDRLVPGYNWYDLNTNTNDTGGHGTLVAGAAAASTNNSIGVSGVGWNAKIMPIKVTPSGSASLGMLARGITYAADNGARVANLSFEAAGAYATVITATDYMNSKGGIVVSAAGNTSSQITSSSCTGPLNGIIVGGTGSDDVKMSMSSYGPCVTMSAPGMGIWTTRMDGTYTTAVGTSLASPLVAGAAALVIAVNPLLTSSDIKKVLYDSALDLGDPGLDFYYGFGRVDLAKAVELAKVAIVSAPPPPPEDTTPPVISSLVPASGTTIKTATMSISASATDNVAVTSMTLLINGAVVASSTSGNISYSWNTKKLSRGTYSILVQARDKAGNMTSKSATLSK